MHKESRVTSSIQRVHALFGGSVQGVGFRYTTIHIAHSYAITGYVKNLDDGGVEVVAEGAEETLRDFISAVRESPLKRYIDSVQIDYSVPRGEFHNFDIRY